MTLEHPVLWCFGADYKARMSILNTEDSNSWRPVPAFVIAQRNFFYMEIIEFTNFKKYINVLFISPPSVYTYFYFVQDIHLPQERLKLEEQKCKEKKPMFILWYTWDQRMWSSTSSNFKINVSRSLHAFINISRIRLGVLHRVFTMKLRIKIKEDVIKRNFLYTEIGKYHHHRTISKR